MRADTLVVSVAGVMAMTSVASGQVCSAYDHGATTYSQGADPTMATIVMLVFMGALVLCASTPPTPLWMPLHYCACTPIFTDSPRQAMMASPSQ
jgi:hypothetical protein